jgi:hypothetical protein
MAARRRDARGIEAGRRARAERGTSSAGGGYAPSILAWGLGGMGMVVAVVAFFLVDRGDITVAPLLLVVAYLVLFPVALVLRDGKGGGG